MLLAAFDHIIKVMENDINICGNVTMIHCGSKNQLQKPMHKMNTFDLRCAAAQQNALLAKNLCLSCVLYSRLLPPTRSNDVEFILAAARHLQHISAPQELFEERSLETKWPCDDCISRAIIIPLSQICCNVTHIRRIQHVTKITQ